MLSPVSWEKGVTIWKQLQMPVKWKTSVLCMKNINCAIPLAKYSKPSFSTLFLIILIKYAQIDFDTGCEKNEIIGISCTGSCLSGMVSCCPASDSHNLQSNSDSSWIDWKSLKHFSLDPDTQMAHGSIWSVLHLQERYPLNIYKCGFHVQFHQF